VLNTDQISSRWSLLISYVALALLPATLVINPARAQVPSKVVPGVTTTFTTLCSSCHGSELQGGQGPALIGANYLHGIDNESVARSIREGFPAKGMPGNYSFRPGAMASANASSRELA
jgi:mono/diheme cytochrome c family protein